jgi:hypothetical protein
MKAFGVTFDGMMHLDCTTVFPDPLIRLVASIQERRQGHIRFSYTRPIGMSVTISFLGGCGDCFVRMPEKVA